MKRGDGLLEDLAGRVADAEEVDWDEAERSAESEEQRQAIHRLRLVESLARVHRGDLHPEPIPRETVDLTIDGGALVSKGTTPGAGGDLPTRRWGHLELLEKLGEGAFGEVFRARDSRLDRDVVVKLLKNKVAAKVELAEAVVREGRLMARVRHRNVVTVHGAERHDGRTGIWMEYIRGRTLDRLLADEGKLGGREAALIGLDLCRALSAIHRAGLIHRDVKARNVMREEGGRILLMDFGAGRDFASLREEAPGSISGTPLYMAPEVFAGKPATTRTDVYSLGVLLYHLVTASYPVETRTAAELPDKHSRREARLLRDERSDLPEPFVRVVERALAWDPQERFATAGQMEQALSAALGREGGAEAAQPSGAGRQPTRRRRFPWIPSLAAAVVVVAAVTTWIVMREPTATRPEPVGEPAVPAAGVGPTDSYTVEASLYRTDLRSGRRRLSTGDRLALGDELNLELEASRDLHVYIVNEDDQGRAYALFPLPHLDLQNPLPGGRTHTLPGTRDGESVSWLVDSRGGREHLLVLASPGRLVEFEVELAKLARPHAGQPAVPLSEDARVRLRGIGGLAKSSAPSAPGSATRLFEIAEDLAGNTERVQGVWMRQIELANP